MCASCQCRHSLIVTSSTSCPTYWHIPWPLPSTELYQPFKPWNGKRAKMITHSAMVFMPLCKVISMWWLRVACETACLVGAGMFKAVSLLLSSYQMLKKNTDATLLESLRFGWISIWSHQAVKSEECLKLFSSMTQTLSKQLLTNLSYFLHHHRLVCPKLTYTSHK